MDINQYNELFEGSAIRRAKFEKFKMNAGVVAAGIIRRTELKSNSEQKVEHIFVAPPYCQAACWLKCY